MLQREHLYQTKNVSKVNIMIQPDNDFLENKYDSNHFPRW